jgi:poly(3-hydroxybutyrate) depolymerase
MRKTNDGTVTPGAENTKEAPYVEYLNFFRDATRFWMGLAGLGKPGWQSYNTIVLDTDAFKLRRFSDGRNGTPILILGPQAGHHTCIVDYAVPGQSLVELCRAATNRPVYAIEWKSASISRRHETIDDLIKQTDQCVKTIGDSVHLVGLCQGGWQSTIYTALHPEKVHSLILGGAPIDFTAGGGKLQDMVQHLPLFFYDALVMGGLGVMSGHYIVAGFKNMNPYERYIKDYIEMFKSMNNPVAVKRSHHFRSWYEHTQDLAGIWYLQAVRRLFKENKLIKGSLWVLGRRVSLRQIACPVVCIAGEKDDITLEPQLFGVADRVSGKVRKMTVPDCGHIGLFIRREALQRYWKPALEFVLKEARDRTYPCT